MRRLKLHSGFTLNPQLLILLGVAVFGGMLYWIWTLQSKLNDIDARGRALRAWLGATDGPAINATGGLTTFLINLKTHLNAHVAKPITGPNAAHTGVADDMHADPPPPPPW